MAIKKLVLLLGSISLILYAALSGLIGSLVIKKSVRDVAEDSQKKLGSLIVSMLYEPLKQGSILEAKNRLISFKEKGYFECAELTVEGMPLTKCEVEKKYLKSFETSSENADFSNLNFTLKIFVDFEKFSVSSKNSQFTLFISLFFFGLLFLFLTFVFLRSVGNEIIHLSRELKGESSESKSYIREINYLQDSIREFVLLRNNYLNIAIREQISKQVAHDIRSPLSTINLVVSSLKGVSFDKLELISSALNRINNISENLLSKVVDNHSLNDDYFLNSIPFQPDPKNCNSSLFLEKTVSAILNEKKFELSHFKEIELATDLDISGKFEVKADITELGRMISNIINNSVEALKNKIGKITLSTRYYENFALLTISDNGKGIPSDILTHLGNRPFTFGKEDLKSGSGLGLSHAQSSIRNWGGELNITSEVGFGTLIELKFLKN